MALGQQPLLPGPNLTLSVAENSSVLEGPSSARKSNCTSDGRACWPYMFLIGAQKSATTSLFDLFHRNGVACGAQYLPNQSMFKPRLNFFSKKEVHLFDAPPDEFEEVLREPMRYARLYSRKGCQVLRQMDATPYLHTWSAPQRVVQLTPPQWLPEMRFLAILREPLSRDLSWYNHRVTEPGWEFCAPSPGGFGAHTGPTYAAEVMCSLARFEACLDAGRAALGDIPPEEMIAAISSSGLKNSKLLRRLYVKCMESGMNPGSIASGVYAMHFYRWTHFIPRSQMMFFEFDKMLESVQMHVNAAVEFFGLPTLSSQPTKLMVTNEHNTNYKLHNVECTTAADLTRTYRPWNEMLYAALAESRSSAPPMEPNFPRFAVRVPCTDVKQMAPNLLAETSNGTALSLEEARAVRHAVRQAHFRSLAA